MFIRSSTRATGSPNWLKPQARSYDLSVEESTNPVTLPSVSTPEPTGTAEEPRWLDADERAAWLSLAGVMTLLPSALDAQLQRDAGLSHFEYMVLAVLSEQPTRTMRMSDLASFANGSLSRLSHVARRLEEQGFLTRQACPEDG